MYHAERDKEKCDLRRKATGLVEWKGRISPKFFALGKIGPETFAERGVVVFKPFKIPQEAIDGEDGLRCGELISPFQQH